jgi:predicted nucleic acid-binding Zn finger protein
VSEEPRDSERGAGHESTPTNGPQWRSRLEAEGELTPEIVEDVLAAHGDRGSRAIDAVGEGRVKQYEDFTVVVGNSDEYVIEEGACTCKAATYNLDPEDPTALCWHALAAEIARAVGAVEHHDMYYSEVRDFI